MKKSLLFGVIIVGIIFGRCNHNTPESKFKIACGSCHLLPDPSDLPKAIWQDKVLPEMGARLGIKTPLYDPMKDMTWTEKALVTQRNIYPLEPLISQEDWQEIVDYILDLAPDTLQLPELPTLALGSSPFSPLEIQTDDRIGSLMTMIERADSSRILIGNGYGKVIKVDAEGNAEEKGSFPSPIVNHAQTAAGEMFLEMGQMTPTELPSGKLWMKIEERNHLWEKDLHRPVFLDSIQADDDDELEWLISEFGHYTGRLRLIDKMNSTRPVSLPLVNLPGIMKTVVKDLNGDGMDDIILMQAQGKEGMQILYRTGNLTFQSSQILSFNSVWGSSWFDTMDINRDGFLDLAVVHGDNADYSTTNKPYHGLRIYLNDGENNFEEAFFFPLLGSTRIVSRDFDQDGDPDFGITCYFPDFKYPEYSLIYLETIDWERKQFNAHGFASAHKGRWLILEAFDYDNDGDEDMLAGSFTYNLTPVPDSLLTIWKDNGTDLLILENKHIDNLSKKDAQ